MKIVSTRENFLKATSLTSQAINPRPSLPILGNFLLTAKAGGLEVTATNLETTMSLRVPVKVEEPGELTAPARLLVDLCQTAADERVSLASDKDHLEVNIGAASAILPTMSAAEFPPTTEFESGSLLELERSRWLEIVAEVVFCTAPEGGRPVLSGVLLQAANGNLALVATDGYRLAKKEMKAKGTLEAIIPNRALQEGVKALSVQEDETIEVRTDKGKNQIQLKTRDLTITSRLLEGDYPNYEQIMPTSFVATVKASTKELAEAIKLTALFAREVGNVVRFEATNGNLIVSASTSQVGEAQTTIAAAVEGEKIKTAFNSRFFLDSLAAIKEKEVNLSLSGVTSAALIRGVGNQSLVYLIMPVRIQS